MHRRLTIVSAAFKGDGHAPPLNRSNLERFVGVLALFFEIVVPPKPQPQIAGSAAGRRQPGVPQLQRGLRAGVRPDMPYVPGMRHLAMPLPTQYPPTYNRTPKQAASSLDDALLRDIRAVLV